VILIQTEEYDRHTYQLVDWLKYYKTNYCIINENTKIAFSNLYQLNKCIDFEIFVDNLRIKYSEISAFWFRRYSIFFQNMSVLNSHSLSINEDIKNHFITETEGLTEFIDYLLEKHTNSIGRYSKRKFNKLIGLEIAKKVGFKIPDSNIVTSLNQIKLDKKNSITKTIKNQLHLETETDVYKLYTEKFENKNLDGNLITTFFPTLFQSQVEKKVELRIFYLRKQCFSMAIFSQNDEQTTVDFRRYNKIKPNRYVPFKLPKKIESRIIKFMNLAELDTGSLDIIIDQNNEYVFIEVNPVGQFGMVSSPCNYFIENEIAKQLKQYE